MLNVIMTAGALAYLGVKWYWRSLQPEPSPVRPEDRIALPKVEDGVAVPLVFGRCLVRRPVIAWRGPSLVTELESSPSGWSYQKRLLFVAGVGFQYGISKFANFSWSERLGVNTNVVPYPDGLPPEIYGFNMSSAQANENDDAMVTAQSPVFFDGNINQDVGQFFEDAGYLAGTATPNAEDLPTYRGQLAVHLQLLSYQSGIPQIGIEVKTYPVAERSFAQSTRIGEEANPADVIGALLCDRLSKHGQDWSVLDADSFGTAARTLRTENHGFSMCWDSRTPTSEMIDEVLRQIDGVLWQNQHTGKWHLKLVRGDYNPPDLPHLTPANCRVAGDTLNAGGWTDLPNAVRVIFEDREDSYHDNSATAGNPANAVGQDGDRIEVTLHFPGIKTAALAREVAARELAWMSKPLCKCQVLASREFLDVEPGSVVKLTYPELNLSSRYMRVAGVKFGTASDNHVLFDLIEDAHYVKRNYVVQPGGGGTSNPVPPLPSQT